MVCASPHLSKLRQVMEHIFALRRVKGIPRYTWALQALTDSCAT